MHDDASSKVKKSQIKSKKSSIKPKNLKKVERAQIESKELK